MLYNIAISGGGANALAFLGCMKYLEESFLDISIKNYAGSSSGSLLCLFMILNFSFEETVNFVKKHLIDDSTLKFSFTNVIRIFSKYGLDDGSRISRVVESILETKGFDKNTTFLEITKRTGKTLVVATTNISQKRIEYISVENNPEMNIVTAIKMSTAIPLLFDPVKYYDDLYGDGLVFNNFPINVFDDSENTLGLNLYVETDRITTFTQYLNSLMYCFIDNISVQKSILSKNVCNIKIDKKTKNFDFSKMKFIVTSKLVDEYIETGYSQLQVFFNKSN
jgi:predicted acylesterase/phospholipase RssA